MSTVAVTKAAPKAPRRKKAAPEAPAAPAGLVDLKAARRAAMLLKQASDPTRVRVLLLLADAERHVGAITEAIGQSQPACSHHLALLRHGGLVEIRRMGKQNIYKLTNNGQALARVIGGVMAEDAGR
jgi:DNA-binding transcriptional ArsR family regulator